MFRTIKIFILLIFVAIFFNKQLITYYYSYKFSKWIEREFIFDKFDINYPNSIAISGIKIINPNPIFYDYILEADKIALSFDLKSLLFSKLVIVNNLTIEAPKFYLEIIEKKNKSEKSQIIYTDNIGIAKKINANLPDKIWPEKKKDINFIILKSNISEGRALITASSINNSFEIIMPDMQLSAIGNKKGYQHYKNILGIMLFNVFARVTDPRLKKLLKKIYKL